MIGNRKIADLLAIVAAGASLDVNGNSYSADDLKSLAAALVKGATCRYVRACETSCFIAQLGWEDDRDDPDRP